MDDGRNQEAEVLAEFNRRRARMHPLARTTEEVDDFLACAIDRAQKRLAFHISDDHASDWAPLLGAMVIAQAILTASESQR